MHILVHTIKGSVMHLRLKISLRFLVTGCFKIDAVTRLFFVFFFLPTNEIRDTCIRGYWNQTKFPIHKVWWLREGSQVGQTFIPLCEKVI